MRLRRDQRGASLVEYLILCGLIALVAVFGFRVFGRSLRDTAQRDAACVATLGPGCENRDASSGLSGTTDAASSSTSGESSGSQPLQSYWATRFLKGFGLQAADTALGLGKIAIAATPPGLLYTSLTGKPNPAVEAVTGLGKLALSASPAGRLVADLGGPDPLRDAVHAIGTRIKESWRRDKAETMGRGAFEVAMIVVPIAKAKWAAEAAGLARTAEESAAIARASEASLEEGSRVSGRFGDWLRTGGPPPKYTVIDVGDGNKVTVVGDGLTLEHIEGAKAFAKANQVDVVLGHGTPDTIGGLPAEELPVSTQPGQKILFMSCNTGCGPMPVAQQFAARAQVYVTAPTAPVQPTMIGADGTLMPFQDPRVLPEGARWEVGVGRPARFGKSWGSPGTTRTFGPDGSEITPGADAPAAPVETPPTAPRIRIHPASPSRIRIHPPSPGAGE